MNNYIYQSLSLKFDNYEGTTYYPQENSSTVESYSDYIPVSQISEKAFKTFTVRNNDVNFPIKGGEIGFIISQATSQRKIISLFQKSNSKAKHNSDAIHAFVVCALEDQDTIRTAEAFGSRGLKESKIHLNDLEDDEEMVFFQAKDPVFRSLMIKNALKNVDNLPSSNFFKHPELYEKEYSTNLNKNTFYSNSDCIRSITLSSSKTETSLNALLSMTADAIKGDFFTKPNGCERQSFMCSSFSTICYQVSRLECELDSQKLSQMNKRDIVEFLRQTIVQNTQIKKILNADVMMQLDYRKVSPAELKTTLEKLSDLLS